MTADGESDQQALTAEQQAELVAITKKILQPGKGILAADESTGSIGKRLASINVENNENNRRKYRELLFTTPNFGENLSGVILYEETFNQLITDLCDFFNARYHELLWASEVEADLRELKDSIGELISMCIAFSKIESMREAEMEFRQKSSSLSDYYIEKISVDCVNL